MFVLERVEEQERFDREMQQQVEEAKLRKEQKELGSFFGKKYATLIIQTLNSVRNDRLFLFIFQEKKKR